MNAQQVGLATMAAGVAVIALGLLFLPSEVLAGPVGLILIVSGLAIAAKGAGA